MNNLTIAKTHSTNRKLVAYCVAKASLLALIVNTLVVPAGLVCIVFMLHLPWYETIIPMGLLLIVGGLLAITVDGMTMGACARLRRTFEKRVDIKNRYGIIAEKEAEIEQREKYELGALRPSYTVNGLFIVIFTLISMGAGELFWHTLLWQLPMWLSWSLSGLFSVAVSVTLIASELLKSQNEEIVEESIESVKFHKKAFEADAQEEAMSILHAEYVKQVEALKANTPMISTTVEEKVTAIYNDLLFDGENIIQKRIEADTVARERAERKRLDRVREQQALLSGTSVSSPSEERDTGPIQQITSPKFKKLGNAQKVAKALEKYGEPYIRQNIDVVSSEIGMHKSTIYSHLKMLSQA